MRGSMKPSALTTRSKSLARRSWGRRFRARVATTTSLMMCRNAITPRSLVSRAPRGACTPGRMSTEPWRAVCNARRSCAPNCNVPWACLRCRPSRYPRALCGMGKRPIGVLGRPAEVRSLCALCKLVRWWPWMVPSRRVLQSPALARPACYPRRAAPCVRLHGPSASGICGCACAATTAPCACM